MHIRLYFISRTTVIENSVNQIYTWKVLFLLQRGWRKTYTICRIKCVKSMLFQRLYGMLCIWVFKFDSLNIWGGLEKLEMNCKQWKIHYVIENNEDSNELWSIGKINNHTHILLPICAFLKNILSSSQKCLASLANA